MGKALYDNKISSWRAMYNPLQSLTIQRYVQSLVNAEMGYFSDRNFLWQYVERRDPVLRAVVERRLSALKKLGYNIKIKKNKEGAKAKKQQQYLTECYERVDNLIDAVQFMGTASFRGFSHLEKHYKKGQVVHLEPVPQFFWAMRLPSRNFLYNAKAFQTATGVPIDEEDWIIRQCDRPIDEPTTFSYIRKAMALRDWDGFLETYGIPALFVTMPQGVGTSNPNDDVTNAYQQLAEQVISDGRGVLPFGSNVVNPTQALAGRSPFSEYLRYQDEQIVLAATSGLLGTLTASTGMNDSQASSHDSAFNSLAKAEALEISEIFQRQFDTIELAREFPNEEPMVYFELEHQTGEEDDPVSDAQKLSAAGYTIDVAQLSEKTGYTLTLKQAPGMGQPGQPGEPGQDQFGEQQEGQDGQEDQGREGEQDPEYETRGDTEPDEQYELPEDTDYENKAVLEKIHNAIQAEDDKIRAKIKEAAEAARAK